METSFRALQSVEPRLRPIAAICVLLISSLLMGGITSFAQGMLPDALGSFANSASGWTILTALTIWTIRTRPGLSAVLGALGFVGLVLGYTCVSGLRGIYYNPLLFGVIGLVVGPFVGVAASLLHSREWTAAAGVALLSGIGVGEMIYGLVYVGDTTDPTYWVVVGVTSVVLLAVVVLRRISILTVRASAVALTALVAGAFLVAYSSIGAG